ncbi:MAG: hypothetical protein LBB35_02695 [Coriobacteriaceae bacterium]|jgi:hypothetical protein|nr:hypothetical protein [Coriobacteriaceae bacterium]
MSPKKEENQVANIPSLNPLNSPNPPAPLNSEAVSEQPLADPVILNTKPSARLLIIVSLVFLPLSLITLYGAFFADNDTTARIVGGCFGGALLLLWIWLALASLRTRSAFVAIGSQGINRHINGDTWLSWNEIGSVGISVLYSQAPTTSDSAALVESVLPSAGIKIAARIRIAGATSDHLFHRPELDKWRTNDEPEPYTHKVVLPTPPTEALENLTSVSLAHAALTRYAGSRYTGVEYRKTVVGRYS